MPAPQTKGRSKSCGKDGKTKLEIPAFGYRVLREGEKPWTMREPETARLSAMSWSDMRFTILNHINDGNDSVANPYKILSLGTHKTCVLLGRERRYLYGDEPVYVRIDMSKIPDEHVIPMNTDKAGIFHLHEEDPRISQR